MFPQQAVALICVSTVFPALAIVAVGLRVYARFLAGIRLNWSDYMIFFTLLNAVLGAIACIIGAVACGIGRPLSELPEWMQSRFMKILFATQFFYIFSVWGAKVSALLFYKGIFPTPRFQRAVKGTLVFLLAWIIAFFFVTLFQDKPIQRNWGSVGTTINFRVFYVVEITTDLALDIFILCMPLPVIKELQMSRKKKWLLGSVFWLGAVIVVASTVRLYYMIRLLQEYEQHTDDFSMTTVNTVIWGSIEPCTSVVAACLPILAPILLKKRRAKSMRRDILSSFRQRTGSGPTKPPIRGPISQETESIDRLNSPSDWLSLSSMPDAHFPELKAFEHDLEAKVDPAVAV